MSLNQSDITPSEDFLQKLSVFARKPMELILKASLKELSILERDFDMHKNYEARNILLSWLLSSGRITTLGKPYSIEIDTLGLYINIPKGSKEGIHAHLPFRHVHELVLSEIKNRGLMSPDDLNELISQKNIINARGTARLTETTRTFTDRILGLDQIEEICKAVGLDMASVSKNPSLLFETKKKELTSAILSGKRIPLQCLLAYLSDSDTSKVRDHTMNLLSIANTLGQELSGTSVYDEVY